MQHQPMLMDAFGQTGLAYQHCRMLGAFLFMNLPAHDLATVDVDDQVQAVEQAFGRGGQEGNVSTPNLVWSSGLVALGLADPVCQPPLIQIQYEIT